MLDQIHRVQMKKMEHNNNKININMMKNNKIKDNKKQKITKKIIQQNNINKIIKKNKNITNIIQKMKINIKKQRINIQIIYLKQL